MGAVQRFEQGESMAALARALEVNPNLLHRWRQEYRHAPATAFPGQGRRGAEPDRVAQWERQIGQQALEIDFLKGCLQRIEEQRPLQALYPEPLSTPKSKASDQDPARSAGGRSR